ncbi:sigma factor [Microbacterium arborescens]|uniref:sigma factor n=1 Tax=Microbacterium arborescens TaxID=33883 RepID=UPI00278AE532|nr:sigma factor [Microbacterium arborescens]MDQ1218352.1 DNA-directed RNA polymerase specialized sigma24 family protein [Microbacterium arborescens]
MTDLLAPDTAADKPSRPGSEAELRALLTAVAAGDRSAFAELYDATAGAAFGLALRLTASREAAEDAVRQAFLDVWREARWFDAGAGTVRAWILARLRRRAVGRGRLAEIREALTRLHDTSGRA